MIIIQKRILRDNGILVVRVGMTIYKLPFTPAAAREINLEKETLVAVKRDQHFSHYLLDYLYLAKVIVKLPYLELVAVHQEGDSLIRRYFEESLMTGQPLISLSALPVCSHFSDFIKEYLPEQISFWADFMKQENMPQSSVHGDFQSANILVNEGRLYFIDWGLYEQVSCRFFDLINYLVFPETGGQNSWLANWQTLAAAKNQTGQWPDCRPYLKFFVVWKIAQELKMLKLRKKLTPYKVNKYLKIIAQLKNYLSD